MKKWLTDHWFEILGFKVLIGGSTWYLYFADNASRAVMVIILFMMIVAIFARLEEIRKSGSNDISVFGFELLLGAVIAIILNLAGAIAYIAYAEAITDSFGFLAQQEFWADIIGSNCLIILILFVIPEIITNLFYDEVEETDFSYYIEELGFPY